MLRLPFLGIGVCFACGIALSRMFSFSPVNPAFALLLMPPFLLWLRGKKFFWPVFCVSVLILGAVHAEIQESKQENSLHRWINRQRHEVRISVQGFVKSEPELKIQGRKRTASYVLETDTLGVREFGRTVYKKMRGDLQIFQHQPEMLFYPGDKVRLWGSVRPLPEAKNPGEFDYRQYLSDRGISGIMTLYGKNSARRLEAAAKTEPPRLLMRTREIIRGRIQNLFSRDQAIFIQALILGDRKNISREWKDDFLRTGTSHLLAISGLNISLAAGSFYFLLIFLGISQKIAAGGALFLTAVQVALGGFGIPLQRAGIMAAVGFASLMTEREKNSLNTFFLAFFCLLWADPRGLWQISFQLSFLSLLCLILFAQNASIRQPWLEPVAGGLALLAGTFPVVVYHFHTFSISGLIVNLLAIPLFHMVLLTALMSLILGGLPVLGAFLIYSCGCFLEWSLAWIHFSAKIDWGYFFLPPPSLKQMVLYYGLIGLFFLSPKFPRFRRAAQIAVLGLWAGTAAFFFRPLPQDSFQAVFFSAGSNDLCHLRFSRENQWLINSGRSFPGDQAEWILAPYLRAQGTKNLKGILFTDYLKRHTAGFETLKRTFRFGYEIYPVREKGTRGFEKQKAYFGSGDRIKMPEGAEIEILDHRKERFTFRLKAEGESILYLPGANYPVFETLRARGKEARAEVLVFPSLKHETASLLKSLLTLTGAQKVIAPVFSEEVRHLLSEKKIEAYELAAEGAVKVDLQTIAGAKQFRVEPFLNL